MNGYKDYTLMETGRHCEFNEINGRDIITLKKRQVTEQYIQ